VAGAAAGATADVKVDARPTLAADLDPSAVAAARQKQQQQEGT
jgi:ribosomal protein L11 methylase PrmA